MSRRGLSRCTIMSADEFIRLSPRKRLLAWHQMDRIAHRSLRRDDGWRLLEALKAAREWAIAEGRE